MTKKFDHMIPVLQDLRRIPIEHDDIMESFSALLALCAGNSPVTGEFP